MTDSLRREIDYLGKFLREAIRESAGESSLNLIDDLAEAAAERRTGRGTRVHEIVRGLNDQQIRIAIRSFTMLLDLLNVAEDRRRVKVLHRRRLDALPNPASETIGDAIRLLKERGLAASEIQSLIDRLDIDLVFTAHPTEAKRRSIRGHLGEIRSLMGAIDAHQPSESPDDLQDEIQSAVTRWWQTDFIRPWRPTVMQEVERGLSFKPVLWQQIPRIHHEFDHALAEDFGDEVRLETVPVRFASWIGGDRDGHPGVTSDVTTQSCQWLRREAIRFHLSTCEELRARLSLSKRQVDLGDQLEIAVADAVGRWPELKTVLTEIAPNELCRQWLAVIRWRLQQTERAIDDTGVTGHFRDSSELARHVFFLKSAVSEIPGGRFLDKDIRQWLIRIQTFGLHLARLDVRQNAKVYRSVVDELLRKGDWSPTPESLSEAERCELLETTLGRDLPDDLTLTDETDETLNSFRVLHQICKDYSSDVLGAHIVSMTSRPSDMLSVIWLWSITAPQDEDSEKICGPVVPLLETIDDLTRGPEILEGMLSIKTYREHLNQLGDRQIVMLGYSDSTKDGGYISACWSLYRAQQKLDEVAGRHGVELTFFHGRGGSLGRGGGPAARSILSLPRGTFDGSLRLTEQGEVLAERYDDPAIAHRHLEQVIWSALLSAASEASGDKPEWYELMSEIDAKSLHKYRQLIESPGFVDYFRTVTPISEIERLPIGSRPSRRKPDGGLSDLRAIPWVFSWTQTRCLIPAWYGIGSSLKDHVDDEKSLGLLRNMYEQWPFFRTMIDNAELALAKSDPDIAAEYGSLIGQRSEFQEISDAIAAEHECSRAAVLAINGRDELLDSTPWLKAAIGIRNQYIDPLNLMQVELLRRLQSDTSENEELRHLARLSINGIAAGMRTSG